MKEKKIVISGIRPTGKIHLGNYNSVIKNWLILQESYKCFFFIADVHALTTDFNNINEISKNTHDMIIELLALGLDPKKCNIFIQSSIPEIFEVHTIISMMINITRLERIPSYKDEKNIACKTYGFLGYPILQAADVLSLNANYVPVGQDQIPHIELISEIANKINKTILKNNEFKLNEPKFLLNDYPKILGIDGKKMSKSKNNAIFVSDTNEVLKKKINKFITDPNRIYRTQKGNPEICPVWSLHKIYSANEKNEIKHLCETAKIACTECKNILFTKINNENKNISTNIIYYEKKKDYINDIIKHGIEQTRIETIKNISKLKNIFKI
ncbi:MAG TPA: tryptophan--tRNA ligase [Candidatus Azoamicus sp. MARI]